MKLGYEKYKENKKVLDAMKNSYKLAQNQEDKIRAQQLFMIFIIDFAKMTFFDLDYYEQMLDELDISDVNKNRVLNEISHIIENRVKLIDIPLFFNKQKNSIVTELTEAEKDIRDYEASKFVEKINEDFKNPNHSLISTWVHKFASFIELYKNTIDFDKILVFINDTFNKNDKNNEYQKELNELLKLIEDIRNSVKNDKISTNDLEIKDIHFTSNEVVEQTNTKIIKEFLNDFDIKLDIENNLVSIKDLKKNTDIIKGKLLKQTLDKENELIDSEYKKIAYTSMLISKAQKRNTKNYTSSDSISINENYTDELMKKGLGKC